jgi:RNA polymerase sigma-70 factor (ECF subfamily)
MTIEWPDMESVGCNSPRPLSGEVDLMRVKAEGKMTDEEIARGLHSRDAALIALLIEEHGGRLLRYLLLLTRNRSTAEDLFQETWIRVLERGHQYRGGYGFQAWLLGIARHLVIDLSRHKRPLSIEDLGCDGQPFDAVAASVDSPLDRLCSQEMRERVHAQARRLPRAHREVLLRRVDDEMLLAEIAETMSVPLSTVKGRLYRAIDALHSRLNPAAQTAECSLEALASA